jgi:hypothetical protein
LESPAIAAGFWPTLAISPVSPAKTIYVLRAAPQPPVPLGEPMDQPRHPYDGHRPDPLTARHAFIRRRALLPETNTTELSTGVAAAVIDIAVIAHRKRHGELG